MGGMSEEPESLAPRHPLYLDVPMMTSFLAYLEGGVAESLERISTSKDDISRQREGGAGLKVPSVFSMLGFDASGRMASTTASGSTDEVKIARQHTSASLFNLLYDQLQAESMLKTFGGAAEDLSTLVIGDLVQVTGRYVGNPLEDVLAVVNQLLPYFAPDASTSAREASSHREAGRSGNPAKKAAARPRTPEELAAQAAEESSRFGMAVVQQMYVEIQSSSVSDVMLRTDSGLRIVATVAREFLTEQVAAMLRSSHATVLGKITALPGESESINLTRRTAMGAMDGEQARDILNSFTGDDGMAWNTEDPIVNGPTAQIMPLAIYI